MIKKIKDKLNFAHNKNLFKILLSYSKGFKMKILFITSLKTLNALSSIAIALITKEIIDAAVSHDKETIYFFATVLIILLFSKILWNRFAGVYLVKIRETVHNHIQAETIESVYHLDFLKATHFKTGDLTTRTSNDISKIVDILLSTLPNIVTLIIQLITAFMVLSAYDNMIAITAFIIGPTTILFSTLVGFKLKKLQAEIQIAISNLKSHITESLQNLELITTFQIEDKQLELLDKYQKNKKRLRLKKALLKAIANGIIDFGFTIGLLGAVLIGAYKLYLGEISFGTFTAFSQLVAYIQGPMLGLSKTLPGIITVLASVERVEALQSEKQELTPTIKNKEVHQIIFKDVSFAYKVNEPILNKITLTFTHQEHTAIVGKSGEGKTTLIRLLLALIPPDEGNVTIIYKDGSENTLSKNNRNLFSYVPQQNSLFSGTIRENLKLMNSNATDEDMIKALKSACIDEFIQTLPNGLDTEIGERLEGLSHGQAQRLCIARALVHDTQFLILDEATSAIDQPTEVAIYEAIKTHYAHKTIIGITHRDTMLDICKHTININAHNVKETS